MVDVHSLDPIALEKFLERRRANPPLFPLEMSLADNLVEVLRKANEFVPSEAGSILLDDPTSKHLYFGDETGTPGTVITFFEYPDAAPGRLGAGSTHHIAFAVDDEAAQLEFQKHLESRGVAVSGPYDRTYFRSIYFRDNNGHILEIATRGPGFLVDETAEELGTHLMLPPEQKVRGQTGRPRTEPALAEK